MGKRIWYLVNITIAIMVGMVVSTWFPFTQWQYWVIVIPIASLLGILAAEWSR